MSDINVTDLFADAQDEGLISPNSATLLTGLSARIDATMAPLAVAPTNTEQTLLAMLLDNTPSMLHNNNHESAVNGYNLVLDALLGAKAVNSVEVLPLLLQPDAKYIRGICGADEFKWKALRAADKLPLQGYVYGTCTPLYERALAALGSAVARTKWWEDEYSVQTRSVTLLMSDGENNYGRYKAADVASVVKDMLAAERHRVLFWGLQGADTSVDFRQIGASMGIPDACIRVIPSDPKVIRAEFQLFSQSMTAAASAGSDDDFANIGFGKS